MDQLEILRAHLLAAQEMYRSACRAEEQCRAKSLAVRLAKGKARRDAADRIRIIKEQIEKLERER